MATITIKRVNGQVVYDPPSLKLDPTSDFVIWSNEDAEAEHQPTAATHSTQADYWLPYPLPRCRSQPYRSFPSFQTDIQLP